MQCCATPASEDLTAAVVIALGITTIRAPVIAVSHPSNVTSLSARTLPERVLDVFVSIIDVHFAKLLFDEALVVSCNSRAMMSVLTA